MDVLDQIAEPLAVIGAFAMLALIVRSATHCIRAFVQGINETDDAHQSQHPPTLPDMPSMRDCDFEGARRRLRSWTVKRCVVCGVAVFCATLVLRHPQFGTGGPNHLEAALVAIAAVAMTGVLGEFRSFLHVQQIMADRTGSTLFYQLGRWLRAHLTKRTTSR